MVSFIIWLPRGYSILKSDSCLGAKFVITGATVCYHTCRLSLLHDNLSSKVRGANTGSNWGRQNPGGPHVGPMNFAIWNLRCHQREQSCHHCNSILTHWGRVTGICVGKLAIIVSDNGLSPGQSQTIIRINAGILLTLPLGTKFSETLIEIQTFSLKKIRLKMSSAKCCLFRLDKKHVSFGIRFHLY